METNYTELFIEILQTLRKISEDLKDIKEILKPNDSLPNYSPPLGIPFTTTPIDPFPQIPNYPYITCETDLKEVH